MRAAIGTELRILHDDDHQRVGELGPLHLVHYRRSPRVRDLRRGEELHGMLRARYPGKTGVLVVADGGLAMPDADVRACANELLQLVSPQLRCSATVLREGGFWASVAISVLTGLFNTVQRGPCPLRIFKELDPAALWVTQHLGDPPISPRLVAAATEVFAGPIPTARAAADAPRGL